MNSGSKRLENYLPKQALLSMRLERLQQKAEVNRAKRLDDPVSWIQNNFWIPELNGPIELYPHQQAVLREAYRRDDEGKFVYSVVVWSDVKKSAKSCIASAVALHRGFMSPWGSIKIVANDLKQANSRVNYYMRRAVTLHPKFVDEVRVRYSETLLPNHCIIEAIPVDPKGEAGGNDDLIVFSELWAANQKAALQMWTEMTLSPTKFGYSQRWVETYAGYEGESPTLENLYDLGVEQGEQLDLSYDDHDLSDLRVFSNHDAGLLLMWNTRARLPWQTKKYYKGEEAILTPEEFLRVHRNSWVSSTNIFVNPEWWDNCEVASMPEFTKHDPMVLAADAGVADDTFAIVGTTRKDGLVYVRYVGLWEPPQGGKIDYYGTTEEPGPERELLRLAMTYNIEELRYDEYQLHDMATRLSRGVWVDHEGVPLEEERANFDLDANDPGRDFKLKQSRRREQGAKLVKIFSEPFSQGVGRLKSDKQLYDLIRAQRLVHQGDERLTEHVKNANRKQEGEKGIRLVKRAQAKKIDLTVALAMSASGEDDDEPPPLEALQPEGFKKASHWRDYSQESHLPKLGP